MKKEDKSWSVIKLIKQVMANKKKNKTQEDFEKIVYGK